LDIPLIRLIVPFETTLNTLKKPLIIDATTFWVTDSVLDMAFSILATIV
jgi:hypothetical protein